MGPGRLAETRRPDLSPLPEGEPLSADAFRLRAVVQALSGDVALMAGLVRHEPRAAEGILSGLEMLSLRQDRDRFGPAEGMLGPAAADALAAAFSPTRTYSVTELEDYASCPFRYFLLRQLGIEPVEDWTVHVDYRVRGRLVHEVLAELHRRLNQLHGGPARRPSWTRKRIAGLSRKQWRV